jgi:arylsulfatase A-like enzyme
MTRKAFIFLSLILFVVSSCTDNTRETVRGNSTQLKSNPKLVVGIVVDQMRYDYLTRFYDRFGAGGFKRLINQGFNCKNNHFNYIPTYTGPGHASVYTGTTPKYHGIISNNWYDKVLKDEVYCVSDEDILPVGTDDDYSKNSPNRMMVNTLSDELKLHTQQRGKVIGIAIKDRGAVLPAGFSADAAYWFEGKDQGHWVSSSYYMDELPDWVKSFNDSGKVDSYMTVWDTLEDIDSYSESGPDLNDFEVGFSGKKQQAFPTISLL